MGLDLNHFIPVKNDEPNDGYQILTVEEITDYPSYLAVFGNFLQENDSIFNLYFRVLGYQRKGMSFRFYKDFKSDYYFDLSSVQNAYNYLQGDHISSLEELQANFQANFINNFVFGSSVFFVSY